MMFRCSVPFAVRFSGLASGSRCLQMPVCTLRAKRQPESANAYSSTGTSFHAVRSRGSAWAVHGQWTQSSGEQRQRSAQQFSAVDEQGDGCHSREEQRGGVGGVLECTRC